MKVRNSVRATWRESSATVPSATRMISPAPTTSRTRRLRTIRSQAISHAEYGLDRRGGGGSGLQLAAEVGDVRVDGTVERLGIRAERALDQLGTRKGPARGARQRLEQTKLARRQLDLPAR